MSKKDKEIIDKLQEKLDALERRVIELNTEIDTMRAIQRHNQRP